jgi:hypothetical protein
MAEGNDGNRAMSVSGSGSTMRWKTGGWKTGWTTLALLAAVAVAGVAGSALGGTITLSEVWRDAFWARFQHMLIFAILIERSVEVYLNAAGKNGDDRFNPAATPEGKIKDATRPATIAAIVLSVLLALSGVRLLETVGQLGEGAEWFTIIIWYGVDIVISAGLMAGGSNLFHEVSEAIRGGLKGIGRSAVARNEQEK